MTFWKEYTVLSDLQVLHVFLRMDVVYMAVIIRVGVEFIMIFSQSVALKENIVHSTPTRVISYSLFTVLEAAMSFSEKNDY